MVLRTKLSLTAKWLSGREVALRYLSKGSRLGVDTFFLEVKEKEYL